MLRNAPNATTQLDPSMSALGEILPSFRPRMSEWSIPPFAERMPFDRWLRFGQPSAAEVQGVTSVHERAFRLVSRPLLGITLRGLSGALRQARSSASAAPPSGLRFPPAADPP